MKVIIVGGGLVGSLLAISLAKEDHDVHLYELRSDIRLQPRFTGVSINLALSVRGITALKAVGLDEEILNQALPMHSRMIHSHAGKQTPQPYGKDGQAINSIDRRNLNEVLLSAAEGYPNVTVYFEHRVVRHSPEKRTISFTHKGKDVHDKADLFIGADGAYSTMRRQIMRESRMNFEQYYIPHGYKELTIPPSSSGDFMLSPEHLHIWPRSTFMLIALPNQDKTFTLTLFMPFSKFDTVKTKDDIIEFFEAEFPDTIPLIGREKLIHDFTKNKTSPLVQVKCFPYSHQTSIILGDAAHAMVPFYGQGMNAGLEDCRLFTAALKDCLKDSKTASSFELAAALKKFGEERHPSAVAICDLAQYNYIEMRDLVNSRWYLMRKKLDGFLNRLLPSTFIPHYTMVTFTNMPYAEVVARKKHQDAMVHGALATTGACIAGIALYQAFRAGLFKH